MEIEDEGTWPDGLMTYLEAHYEIFRNWKTSDRPFNANLFDSAIYGLREILRKPGNFLKGYHCTRLTEEEIQIIHNDGMTLPNKAFLEKRIESAVQSGLLEPDMAKYLINNNESNHEFRKEMIWFCFYPPRIAGELGIGRFFKSWGGEALYNSHENNDISGPILSNIGTPCIVEAEVPIGYLSPNGGLDFKVVGYYLQLKDIEPYMDFDHEDRSFEPIAAENIVRIIKYPEEHFIELSRCNNWNLKL